MGKAAVSVIVPIYNIKDYLCECLDSIERQTLKDIEVILVNDGSTDGSDYIAKNYCDKNPNFRLINRDNGGLSAARNTGLNAANGEYVYFLDSDDFLADNALEKLYLKAKKDDLDLLKFVSYVFEDGNTDYKWQRENGYMYLGEYPDIYTGLEFYQRIIEYNDYYPSCCLMLTKKKIIDENGLSFFEGIIHEDDLFCFELTVLSQRVALMHEPLYYRRIRQGSITQNSQRINNIRSFCLSAEKTDRFLNDHPQTWRNVGSWQMAYYISTMLGHRELMTRKERYSKEVRSYFERVRPFIAKYGTGGIKSLRVFYYSYFLYRIAKWMSKNVVLT